MDTQNNSLLFTIIVPAYNAADNLHISLPSIVNTKILEEDLVRYFEVIIVNDGSTDNTKQIATKWAKKWNSITKIKGFVRVINKENGQYGSVINTALPLAHGKYVKILDSDDHFKVDAFIKILYITLGLSKSPEVIITNHVFEKVNTDISVLVSYAKYFRPSTFLNTKTSKFPKLVITMHSLIYNTKFLRSVNFHQVEKVYYSDSQFALIPLQYAKKIYYTDIPLYGYYVGRLNQSINFQNMVAHGKDQLVVLKVMLSDLKLSAVSGKHLRSYVIYVIRSMIHWQMFLVLSNPKLENRSEVILTILKDIKKRWPLIYKKAAKSFFVFFVIFFKGRGATFLIKILSRLYSRFRSNVLAEWDNPKQ